MKDLRLIDDDLSRISLLDNSPASFVLYPDNGILVDTWMDDKADTALLNILPFLDALRYVHDVRTILSLKRIRSINN
jgi:TFIIF-interacting CTD phosphatase-like protein